MTRLACAAVVVGLLGQLATISRPMAVSLQDAATSSPARVVLSLEEQEKFLREAKIVRTRGISKGITGSVRATLTDGRLTHDAHIQTIDEYKQRFEGTRGTEFNFRDSWRYNVAAYRLDRLLELWMIPPSIERSFDGKKGAFTWWVDDVLMDEGQRLKTKKPAPDPQAWNEQMWHVRLFDQLIYNVDRNLGNLIIDTNWTIWMIDHTRAFRLFDDLKGPENLAKCDRQVFERLKALDRATLDRVMRDYLSPQEIRALLARRDLIVKHFSDPGRLFDRAPRKTTTSSGR